MKKIAILSAIVLTGSVAAFAQDQLTGNSNVSVTVNDVKTITVTGNPTFTLSSSTDYTNIAASNGTDAGIQSTVNVISRGGYTIKAALNHDIHNDNATNGVGDIPGNKLRIYVAAAPDHTYTGEALPAYISSKTAFAAGQTNSEIVDLVKTETTTGNDNGGTAGTSFNVKYNLGDFPGVVRLATGSFTAAVTYTIEAN